MHSSSEPEFLRLQDEWGLQDSRAKSCLHLKCFTHLENEGVPLPTWIPGRTPTHKAREGNPKAIAPLSKEDSLHSNDFCCFTWHPRPPHDFLQEVNAHAGDEKRMSRLWIRG